MFKKMIDGVFNIAEKHPGKLILAYIVAVNIFWPLVLPVVAHGVYLLSMAVHGIFFSKCRL